MINIKNFVNTGGLTLSACLLTIIFIPLHIHFVPAIMFAWALFWIYENRTGIAEHIDLKSNTGMLFALFLILYIWQIAGLLRADSVPTGFERLFKRLPFLIFPLVLIYPGPRILRNINLLIRLFAISTAIYLIYCYGHAIDLSLSVHDHKLLFNSHPSEFPWESYFYGMRFSDPVHPSYVAMFIILSLLIAFDPVLDSNVKGIIRICYLGMIIIFIVSLYLLSARAGLLALIIIMPVYFLLKARGRYPKWLIMFSIVLLVIISILGIRKNERINSTMGLISDNKISDILKNDPRLLIWQSAIGVIKRHPILGVGTGDASTELKNEFIARGYKDGYYDNLNAHNQFLETFLENGLIGLVIFVSIFAFMFYIAFRQHNITYGLFLVSILIFFIFETMLNRLAGVSYFALFSFLLIHIRNGKRNEVPDS